MKNKYQGLPAVLIIIFFVMISCAGGPKQSGTDTPAPGSGETAVPQAEEAIVEPLPAETAAALPEAVDSPAVPESESLAELAEPELDIPETETAELPRAETAAPETLPEPLAPVLTLPPKPPPPVQPPPPAAPPPPEPVPAPPPVRPVPPRTARPDHPPPPAYLGPAETERPPAIVREPVPQPPPVTESPPVITPIPAPQEKAPDEEIIFSRIVRATVGQLVEIPFRGTGWVFLGEQGAQRGIVYDSRRLDPEGQSFILRTEAAGTYSLKFYKQDFHRDFILNDYVQVIVGEAPAAGTGWFNPPRDQGRIIAEPRWPSSLEAVRTPRENAVTRPPAPDAAAAPPETTPQAIPPSSVPETVDSTPVRPRLPAAPSNDEGVVPVRPPALAGDSREAPGRPDVFRPPPETAAGDLPEQYFQKAKEEYGAGRVAQAIALLDRFREQYPSGSDEAWWLYGQFYEANSPSRDILTALDYYRRLVRDYPQSSRYNDARGRIAYLERYYINIQ
ncbi:MAG: hypothetical protein LBD48_04835 [Treponema sp.]|jgi:TolA-binding protein|nr:hypothetical protein [Treponema sp.]